jgi:hypothetical protein
MASGSWSNACSGCCSPPSRWPSPPSGRS